MAATFNFYEAILWFIIGLILLMNALFNTNKKPYKNNLITAALLFIAFGISDLIEMQTGAWWKPLGLLGLKAICVCGFLFCLFQYHKISTRKK